jgi:prepilin signal peptidase PulO-like enzyme (type II secretory pathway)
MEFWLGAGAGLCGWAAGLLVDYLADWLPARRNLAQAVCPACQSPLTIRSYLPWLHPCPQCGRKSAVRSWLAPAVLAAGGVWLARESLPGISLAFGLLILAYFTLVVVIDLEHHLILHVTSLAGGALGLATGWLRNGLVATLLGALAAWLIMLAIYLLGKLFGRPLVPVGRRSVRSVPFGFGDVLLATVVGLMTGWPDILTCLFIAVLAAGAFSLVYLIAQMALRRYRPGSAIPYAPFLIFGGFCVLFSLPFTPLG